MNPTGQDSPAKADRVPWSRALRGALRGRSIVQSATAAMTVGSILFMVNLYSHVRDDPFTWALATRIVLTFFVPWLNATLGIAIGLRRPAASGTPGNDHQGITQA
jgi:hypothetical protein